MSDMQKLTLFGAPHGVVKTLIAMNRLADRDGCVDADYGAIAGSAGVCCRVVSSAIRHLIDAGLVIRTRRGGMRSNTYTIV